MNFMPRNTWERNMAEWRCFMSEIEYKRTKEAEFNSEEAIEKMIDKFALEYPTWLPE